MERLQTPFHADKAARCFGERRNRQQHVGYVQQRFAFIRTKRQHAARLFQRGYGCRTACDVVFGVDIEQDNGFFRRGNHIANRGAVDADDVCAHAVGGLRQNAQNRVRFARQLLRGKIDVAEIGMVLRFRAQQDGGAFSVFQAV